MPKIMPNYSSPPPTPWWKKVISNQWLMGALIGFVIGQFFFGLFGLLESTTLNPKEINIFWYKVTLIIIFWLTGIAVYRILKGKHWVTKLLSVGLVWIGEMAGAFVMFVSSVYFLVRFLSYLQSDLKMKPPFLGVVLEGYTSLVPNVVMIVILFAGAWLIEVMVKLSYKLLKLPKQRLAH